MSNNRPLTVRERQALLTAQYAKNAAHQSTLAEVGRLNLSRWERLTTADGRIYYHDKLTGITQWEEPEAEPEGSSPLAVLAETAAAAAATVTPVPEGIALLPLPPGWQQLIHTAEDGTERPYYEHRTGITQWELPTLPEGWASEVNADGDAYYYVLERNNIPSQYAFPTQTTLANINANRAARRGNAATRIQKTLRGTLARKTAKAVKAAKRAQNASRKIQSLFRGHRNRKTVRAIKTAKTAANAAARAAANAAEEAAQAAANATGSAAPRNSIHLQPIIAQLGLSAEPAMLEQFDAISPSEQAMIVSVLQTGTKEDKKNIVKIRQKVPSGIDMSCSGGTCYYKGIKLTRAKREELRKNGKLPYGLVPGEIFVPLSVLFKKK